MTQPLITDLDAIRRLTEERAEVFALLSEAVAFDGERDDDTLDAWVEAVAAPIRAGIDCTACANCCRTLDVCLIPSDVAPLAEGLLIPIEAVMTRYVDQPAGQAQGEWALVPAHPCPLLNGNLCSIYPHRPHACRVYPQLTPDFRYNVDDAIEGAATCPIIYNTLEALAAAYADES